MLIIIIRSHFGSSELMLAVSDESDSERSINVCEYCSNDHGDACSESSARISVNDSSLSVSVDESAHVTSDESDSVSDMLKLCGQGTDDHNTSLGNHAAEERLRNASSETAFAVEPLMGKLAKLRSDFASWDLQKQNLYMCELVKQMPKGQIVLLGQTLTGRKQFCDLTGMSTTRFDRIKKHVDAGGLGPPPDGRNTSTRAYASNAQVQAHAFFDWLYTNVAESLAEGKVTDGEKDANGLGVMHESMFRHDDLHIDVQAMPELRGITELQPRYLQPLTWQELYEMFEEWWADIGNEELPSSYSTFRRAFTPWEGKLLFRTRGQHKVCEACTKYRIARAAATSDEEKLAVQRALAGHLRIMREDRAIYKHKCLQSEAATRPGADAPDDVTLVICIDGMDQSKFKMPRHVDWQQADGDTSFRPQLHFTGATCHGIAEHYFVADADVRKDPNSTIEMISRVIEQAKTALASRGAMMPRHLWLQVDNTTRENRNTTVLTFLSYLTSRHCFRTATWAGMQVGHTHIDQDQRFSVCGAIIARQAVLENLSDVIDIMRQKVKPSRGRNLLVEELHVARNWTNFFAPLNYPFTGHAGKGSAHLYMFVRYEDMVLSGDTQQLDFGKFTGCSEGDLEGDDVFLLVKHYMSSKMLSQPPMLVMRAADLQLLDVSRVTPGPNLVVMARNPIGCDLAKKYVKTAEAVRQDPWCLDRGAQYLEEWVRQNRDGIKHIDKLWDLEYILKPWCKEERMDASIAIQWEDFAPQEPKIVSLKCGPPKPGATWAPKAKSKKAECKQKVKPGPMAKKLRLQAAQAKPKSQPAQAKRRRTMATSPEEEGVNSASAGERVGPGTPNTQYY